MDTHELAKELNALARALKLGPKIEINDLGNHISLRPTINAIQGNLLNADNERLDLDELIRLTRFSKNDLITFITNYQLSINWRPRDSGWDLLGKIIKYFNTNHEQLQRMRNQAVHGSPKSSSELLKALSSLMKE